MATKHIGVVLELFGVWDKGMVGDSMEKERAGCCNIGEPLVLVKMDESNNRDTQERMKQGVHALLIRFEFCVSFNIKPLRSFSILALGNRS